MNNIKTIMRIILGLAYFVFGLNGFLNFIPVPPNIPPAAVAFSTALFQTGYFFPFLKGTEVAFGLLLLLGFYVPLSLVVLAPITLNIVLFHFFLAPEGMYLQWVMLGMHLFLGWAYLSSYPGILKAKA